MTPPGRPGSVSRFSYNLEARLRGVTEIQRLFHPGNINQICSAPISTQVWGIQQRFPNRTTIPIFEALEAYVGPIAGDKQFSRRMDAVAHTLWLLQSLERISLCFDVGTAKELYAARGIGGLGDSALLLVKLNHIYHTLCEREKKGLWIGALLHDIGKATGNRERHPIVGLAKLEKSPEIINAVRKAFSSTHTDIETETALGFIKSSVGEHDLIGALAITRDRNIFECALAIMKASPHHLQRTKLLDFLTLINFADIDAQSEQGIFTSQKLLAFMEVYSIIRHILESARNKRVDSIDDLINEKTNFAWWGKQRVLAWSRGDTPGFSNKDVEKMINQLIPNQPEQTELYQTLGKVSLIDGMYNFATSIHDPESAIKFLIWAAQIIKETGADAITYDTGFLIDMEITQRITSALKNDQDLSKTFCLTIIASEGKTIAQLSLDT